MTNDIRGVTLLELLIAMAITTGALTLVTFFAMDVSNFGLALGDRLEVERELELTLRTMISEGRSMGPGENGAYPVATATATTFSFYSDIDGDGGFEQVRYFLDGTIIKKGVVDPVGSNPPTYPAANEVITEVVHSVVPGTLFQYFDEGYPPEIGPLASPVDVSNVRMITVTGTTDRDPARPPLPTTLSITITIRNLRGEI
jgi:type II secretory pathway pseudopilin PulG